MMFASVLVHDIVNFLKPIGVIGDLDAKIVGPAPLDMATTQNIAFCNRQGNIGSNLIKNSHAGVVICFEGIKDLPELIENRCLLISNNPRLDFIRCLNQFFIDSVDWQVHPTAQISNSVHLPKKISVGSNTFIGDDVVLGEGTIINHGVSIENGCRIGNNVKIQSGAIIGCTGQGFERNENGVLEKFPQFGNVIIEDNVEIGANATIVRGTFDNTIIGIGTKIGHLTNVGHNVEIGAHVFIAASVVIAGGSKIGTCSWISPGSAIRDAVEIGKNVKIGMGAVITKNIADNQIIVGIPACTRKEYVKTRIWLKKNTNNRPVTY